MGSERDNPLVDFYCGSIWEMIELTTQRARDI